MKTFTGKEINKKDNLKKNTDEIIFWIDKQLNECKRKMEDNLLLYKRYLEVFELDEENEEEFKENMYKFINFTIDKQERIKELKQTLKEIMKIKEL